MIRLDVSDAPGGVSLRVRVIPRAGRSHAVGIRDGALLLRIAAPPVDGAANDAALAFLARLFAVPLRSVTIVSGERSRDKRVLIAGIDAETARGLLRQAGVGDRA